MPPVVGCVTMVRVRDCLPLPQLTLQAPKLPQLDTTQSTIIVVDVDVAVLVIDVDDAVVDLIDVVVVVVVVVDDDVDDDDVADTVVFDVVLAPVDPVLLSVPLNVVTELVLAVPVVGVDVANTVPVCDGVTATGVGDVVVAALLFRKSIKFASSSIFPSRPASVIWFVLSCAALLSTAAVTADAVAVREKRSCAAVCAVCMLVLALLASVRMDSPCTSMSLLEVMTRSPVSLV